MKRCAKERSAIKKNYASVINRIRPLAQATRRSAAISVRPGPGQTNKQQASSSKPQASSDKPQAPSDSKTLEQES